MTKKGNDMTWHLCRIARLARFHSMCSVLYARNAAGAAAADRMMRLFCVRRSDRALTSDKMLLMERREKYKGNIIARGVLLWITHYESEREFLLRLSLIHI